jgi:hypothetical protein
MPRSVLNSESGINKPRDNLPGLNKNSSRELKVAGDDLGIDGPKLDINANILARTPILVNIYYNSIAYFQLVLTIGDPIPALLEKPTITIIKLSQKVPAYKAILHKEKTLNL